MDDLDPKILEYAKSVYGPSCEFVRSTDWSYTFRCGEKSYCRISRFMVEKGIVISAAEFRQRWQSMDERGRVDFAMSFHPRADWKANDSEILDVMIEDGSDPIWRCCALAMLEHRDRDRVVRLLIERVRHATDEGARINYMQALGLAGDRRAVEVMRPHYEKYLRDMELNERSGFRTTSGGDRFPITNSYAWLVICSRSSVQANTSR